NRYSHQAVDTTTISVPIPEAPPKQNRVTMTEVQSGELWNALRAGTATHEERVEFHRRLALPFACLVFTLVGLPLGVSTTRGSKSMGLVMSLILMFLYYLAFFAGTRIAGDSNLSP